VTALAKQLYRSFVDGETARGAVVAIVVKVCGSLLNFVMLLVAARLMGPDEFGHFAVWFNVVSFLALIALCGQETLIVRSWTEYVQQGRWDLARGALTFGAGVALAAATLLAVSLAAASLTMGWSGSGWLVLAAGLFLVAETMQTYGSISTRTIASLVAGEGNKELTGRTIIIALAFALVACGVPITTTTFFFISAAGILPVLIIHAWAIRRRIPRTVGLSAPAHEIRAWRKRSLPMWLAAALNGSGQYLEVILLGLLHSPVAAGGYFVAARLANAFAVVAAGLASFSTTPIGNLFFSGRHRDLQRALKTVAVTTLVLVGIGLVIVVVAGHEVLAVFGSAYVTQYTIFLVLSSATAFMALGGPAMHLLLLTGHEALYSRIAMVCLLLRCTALVVFAPMVGAIAAAIAWSTCTIVMAIALNVACRRLVGIDPSILALLIRRPAAPAALPALPAPQGAATETR
jgi:O-antigen/teichoic acid export membrane protein